MGYEDDEISEINRRCINYWNRREEEKRMKKKAPQNLAKADEYSLLADVRADVKELLEMIRIIPCSCREIFISRKRRDPNCPRCNWVDDDIVNKVSKHFS